MLKQQSQTIKSSPNLLKSKPTLSRNQNIIYKRKNLVDKVEEFGLKFEQDIYLCVRDKKTGKVFEYTTN